MLGRHTVDLGELSGNKARATELQKQTALVAGRKLIVPDEDQ